MRGNKKSIKRHLAMTGSIYPETSNVSDKINEEKMEQCWTTTQCASQCSVQNSDMTNPSVDTSQMSIEERVSLLEKNYDRLNYRTQWQETLHRNVKEDGNITHYFNMVPTIAIAALVGGVAGFAIHGIFRLFARKQ